MKFNRGVFLLVLMLASFKLMALEIEVVSAHKNFKLKVETDELLLTGNTVNMSLKKEKCNEHIFKNFNSKIREILAKKAKFLKPYKSTFEVKVDGESRFERYDSKIGKTYLTIPDEFRRMKIESKIICGK